MVKIKWCLNQRNGLEIVDPNPNMSKSYLNMAQESINILKGVEKSAIWTATTTYYIFYYSLYSFMLRIGVKCEIHACSLEFMSQFLNKFYNNIDLKMINDALKARIDLQYYSDRPVDQTKINIVKSYCKDFFIKTKDNIARITEKEIDEIRSKLK